MVHESLTVIEWKTNLNAVTLHETFRSTSASELWGMYRRWKRLGADHVQPTIENLMEIIQIDSCRMLFTVEALFPSDSTLSVVPALALACLFSGSTLEEKIWFCVCLYGCRSPGGLSGQELSSLCQFANQLARVTSPTTFRAIQETALDANISIDPFKRYSVKEVEDLFKPFCKIYESLPISDRSFARAGQSAQAQLRDREIETEFRAYYAQRQAAKRKRLSSTPNCYPDLTLWYSTDPRNTLMKLFLHF